MGINAALLLLLALLGVGIPAAAFFYSLKKADASEDGLYGDDTDLGVLTIKVRDEINARLKINYDEVNLSRHERERSEKIKSNIRRAKTECAAGNVGAKEFMKDYIADILQTSLNVGESNIDKVIPFDNYDALTVIEKFDLLLYVYRKKYGFHAFDKMVSMNHLDDAREDPATGDVYFEIDGRQIAVLFARHAKAMDQLDFTDKMHYLSQRIYQDLYGHSTVDDLCNEVIDGINCGVSGVPDTFYTYGSDMSFGAVSPERPLTGYNAVWVIYKGKKVRLSFLGFKNEKDLQRVAKNIYRYGDPGMLSADRGYIVNTMKNGSRITVARPPMCEEWSFWLRNFDTADGMDITALYPFTGVDKLAELCRWLVVGERNVAVTGTQGCGKTTFVMNLVRYMRQSYSIRVQEMSAELHLRKMYPRRNIASFTETDTISGQMCVDFTKKTDADIGILGEVAEAPVAAIGIQMAQVGFRQLLFTHHAKSASSLVKAFRDNLTLAGGYSNEKIAEETVAQVLNFNIHLERDPYGRRTVRRITEILPHTDEAYPKDIDAAARAYYYRVTDRQLFDCNDVLVFDGEGFRFSGRLSQRTREEIVGLLTSEERAQFMQFLSVMDADADAFKVEYGSSGEVA